MPKYPLEAALKRFLSPNIPAWSPDEEEIDQPTWLVSEHGSDPNLPGGGLARHSMLYIGEGCNRMFVIHGGKIVWTFDAGKGWEYDDIWMQTNGNIVFTRMYWAAEVTPEKKIIWRMNAPEGTEIHTMQPLDLERVMLVLNTKPLPRLMIINKRTNFVELDREIPYDPAATVHGQFRRFRLTPEGTYLASCLSMGKVIEYDKEFNPIWSYDIDVPWAAIRLKNGNTLITGEKDGVQREVNKKGETVWEFYIDDLPKEYALGGTQTCVRLDNGNTIMCSRGDEGRAAQLVEVTPQKEVVWVLKDWKNLGPATAVQILTESGIPENPGECQR